MNFKKVRLKCSNCSGMKYIGDKYYAFGEYWVDVTCINCSHSKDIKVEDLEKFLNELSKGRNNGAKKQSHNK